MIRVSNQNVCCIPILQLHSTRPNCRLQEICWRATIFFSYNPLVATQRFFGLLLEHPVHTTSFVCVCVVVVGILLMWLPLIIGLDDDVGHVYLQTTSSSPEIYRLLQKNSVFLNIQLHIPSQGLVMELKIMDMVDCHWLVNFWPMTAYWRKRGKV